MKYWIGVLALSAVFSGPAIADGARLEDGPGTAAPQSIGPAGGKLVRERPDSLSVLIQVPPGTDRFTAFDHFVNTTDGSLKLSVDLGVRSEEQDLIPFLVTFNSAALKREAPTTESTALGNSWIPDYSDSIALSDRDRLELTDFSGTRTTFKRLDPYRFVPTDDLRSPYSSVRPTSKKDGLMVYLNDGTRKLFCRESRASSIWRVCEITTASGSVRTVYRNGSTVTRIADTSGVEMDLQYLERGRLASVLVEGVPVAQFQYSGDWLHSIHTAEREYAFDYSASASSGTLLRSIRINGAEAVRYEYLEVGDRTRVYRVSMPSGSRTFEYSRDWRETIVTADADSFRSYRYDELGRTTRVTLPDLAVVREFDRNGRVATVQFLGSDKPIRYNYESDHHFSVHDRDRTLVSFETSGHGVVIERSLVPAIEESRNESGLWDGDAMVVAFGELSGRAAQIESSAGDNHSRDWASRHAVIDSRMFGGRPTLVELRGPSLVDSVSIIEPSGEAMLRPDLLDNVFSGLASTSTSLGKLDPLNPYQTYTNPCTATLQVAEVGDDPDGNGAPCEMPPTDPECQIPSDYCAGPNGGGWEPPPGCSWELSAPATTTVGSPTPYSINGTVGGCIGSGSFHSSTNEPPTYPPNSNGLSANFTFLTVGSRTITATYVGGSKSKPTMVVTPPCDFSVSTSPSTSVMVGQVVTVTPSGNCSAYLYSTTGQVACPASGSGTSFHTQFGTVGAAQITTVGSNPSGGANQTISTTLLSVSCIEIVGPSLGVTGSPVCFSVTPPASGVHVMWSVAGSSATGSDSSFCPTFLSPGTFTVQAGLGVTAPICGAFGFCMDQQVVTITAPPPPTVAISTPSPLVLLGSPTASVSAVGNPPGGTYAWTASPSILSISPANGSQVTIGSAATGVTTLSVTYTTASGTSQPASIQVHAIELAEVKWEGVVRNDGQTNLEIGMNPATRNGGDRIFPDRNHPSPGAGDDKHDRVRVTARLSSAPPPGTSVTVYFKLFDPDHYSLDPDFDPNGILAGEDNVRAGLPISLATAFGASINDENFTTSILSTSFVGDGTKVSVRVGLQLTDIQPGNNWRVAASLQNSELGNVTLGSDGQTLISNGTPWPSNKRTELLTVWRHLYAEIDRMADPVLDVGPGRSRFAGGLATPFSTTLTLGLSGGASIDQAQTDQFEGGRIDLKDASNHTLGTYDVDGNTYGTAPDVILTSSAPSSTATFTDLVDDDIANTSPFKISTSASMSVDTAWWVSRFEPALVVPVFNQPEVAANNQTNVAFQVHTGGPDEASEKLAIRSVVAANKASHSEPSFWVVYQLGAFQGGFFDEGDPTYQGTSGGSSSMWSHASTDAEAGTVNWAESLRDLGENPLACLTTVPNLRKAVSVHEVGHEFFIDDGLAYGQLMDPNTVCLATGQSQLDALQWNGIALKLIMTTRQPGHASH